MSYLELCCRAVLGFTMAIAVVGKTTSGEAWRGFVDSLRAVGWLPASVRDWVAAAVVAVEAAAAVLLVARPTAAVGLMLCAAALSAFTVVTMVSRAAGSAVSCRCFGADEGPIGRWHWLRNLALIALALVGLVALRAAPVGAPQPAVTGLVVSAGALAAVALAYGRDLAFVFGPSGRRH